MSDLRIQRKDIQFIIDYPIKNSLSDFTYSLDTSGFLYAYIVHDKDIKEDGQLKTKHIHMIISSPKRHQLKYYLLFIADSLGVKECQIQIQPCESIPFMLQYFIHKNHKDKYQYNISDIKHNFNLDVFDDYMSMETVNKFSTQDIIDIVVASRGNTLEIIQKIGIQRYSLYRNVINDIYRSIGISLSKY